MRSLLISQSGQDLLGEGFCSCEGLVALSQCLTVLDHQVSDMAGMIGNPRGVGVYLFEDFERLSLTGSPGPGNKAEANNRNHDT